MFLWCALGLLVGCFGSAIVFLIFYVVLSRIGNFSYVKMFSLIETLLTIFTAFMFFLFFVYQILGFSILTIISFLSFVLFQ